MTSPLCSSPFKTDACWDSVLSPVTMHGNRHTNKRNTLQFFIAIRHSGTFSCKYFENNSFRHYLCSIQPQMRLGSTNGRADRSACWLSPAQCLHVCILYLNHTAAKMSRQKALVGLKARNSISSWQILAASYKFSHNNTPRTLRPLLLICHLEAITASVITFSVWKYWMVQRWQHMYNLLLFTDTLRFIKGWIDTTGETDKKNMWPLNWFEEILSWSAGEVPVSNRNSCCKVVINIKACHYFKKICEVVCAIYCAEGH